MWISNNLTFALNDGTKRRSHAYINVHRCIYIDTILIPFFLRVIGLLTLHFLTNTSVGKNNIF